MKILKYENQTWSEISKKNNPIEKEELFIICKQEYVEPPKVNTGEWVVLHWKQDEKDEMNWSVCFVGLFWEIEHAEMFTQALEKK